MSSRSITGVSDSALEQACLQAEKSLNAFVQNIVFSSAIDACVKVLDLSTEELTQALNNAPLMDEKYYQDQLVNDPALATYLSMTKKMTAEAYHKLANDELIKILENADGRAANA